MTGAQGHAYWIHERREDNTSISGFIYLRQCKCSNCGYETNMEKPVCPQCHSVMDKRSPKEDKA